MKRVNVHEAKTHLSRLLEQAVEGEEVVICKAGKPMAKLVKYEESPPLACFGVLKGQIWIADDFDELDPATEAAFYGEDDEEQ